MRKYSLKFYTFPISSKNPGGKNAVEQVRQCETPGCVGQHRAHNYCIDCLNAMASKKSEIMA